MPPNAGWGTLGDRCPWARGASLSFLPWSGSPGAGAATQPLPLTLGKTWGCLTDVIPSLYSFNQ